MFEQPEDLAPDLEWMLGSDQVPRDIILEALVEEHYAEIYRLALSVLSDPGAAKRATQVTIAHALANQYSYRVNMGVDIWLNRFALEACSKEDRSVGQKGAHVASQGIGNVPAGTTPPSPEINLDAQIGSAYDALSLRRVSPYPCTACFIGQSQRSAQSSMVPKRVPAH